eukprot:RCo022687
MGENAEVWWRKTWGLAHSLSLSLSGQSPMPEAVFRLTRNGAEGRVSLTHSLTLSLSGQSGARDDKRRTSNERTPFVQAQRCAIAIAFETPSGASGQEVNVMALRRAEGHDMLIVVAAAPTAA